MELAPSTDIVAIVMQLRAKSNHMLRLSPA